MEQYLFFRSEFVDIADTSSNDEYKSNNALGLTACYFLRLLIQCNDSKRVIIILLKYNFIDLGPAK